MKRPKAEDYTYMFDNDYSKLALDLLFYIDYLECKIDNLEEEKTKWSTKENKCSKK